MEQRAPAPAVSATVVRIAVADLESKGVDEKLDALFLQSLLAEIRKLKRASVIGMDEIRRMLDLEAQKQILGCGEEQSCLAEIAGAVGADVLIVGGIVDLGGERVVALKRIDQKSASVSHQVNQRLTEQGGEEVLAAIGPAVEKLFPDLPLAEGETRGVSPEIALRLNPPPVPVWAFVTSSAIAAGTVVASAATAAWWLASQQSYKDLADAARVQPVAGVDLKAREDNMITAETGMWIALSALAASATTTAVLAPFTDFAGYGQ